MLPSQYNQPTHQNDLPRPAGIASFMRLPVSTLSVSTRARPRRHTATCRVQDTAQLDACIVGVPVDTATSNRPGTRFGPREIR